MRTGREPYSRIVPQIDGNPRNMGTWITDILCLPLTDSPPQFSDLPSFHYLQITASILSDILFNHTSYHNNMAGGGNASIGAAAVIRQQTTGKTGLSTLMENKKSLVIAIFASLGKLPTPTATPFSTDSDACRWTPLWIPTGCAWSSACHAGFQRSISRH
jgi:hypothetical protein